MGPGQGNTIAVKDVQLQLPLLVLSSAAAAAAAPAAAAAAAVVRNKSQKYYSLARSPLRLPGSADLGCFVPDIMQRAV